METIGLKFCYNLPGFVSKWFQTFLLILDLNQLAPEYQSDFLSVLLSCQ